MKEEFCLEFVSIRSVVLAKINSIELSTSTSESSQEDVLCARIADTSQQPRKPGRQSCHFQRSAPWKKEMGVLGRQSFLPHQPISFQSLINLHGRSRAHSAENPRWLAPILGIPRFWAYSSGVCDTKQWSLLQP